jgi:hypothetical protein
MSLLIQDERMARKARGGSREGSGRPKSERNDVAVKIDRAVASKAKAVAQHLGMSVAEVLSEVARRPIDQMYARMLRELESQDD